MVSHFGSLADALYPGVASPVGPDGRVEISRINSGYAESPPRRTTALKYVAAGLEVYRYAGRTHRVQSGSFLVLPEGHRGEALIDQRHGTALGMCVYLPEQAEPALSATRLEAPLIFTAECSALGRLLAATHKAMLDSPSVGPALAKTLLASIGDHFEPFLVDTVQLIDGIGAVKSSTRHETVRRLNVARTYLHSIDHRAVDLVELARYAGVSRFQLARNFRECFGAPPSAYHRRMRLERARDEIRARKISCSDAAVRYGFSDVAHFSHAYRRMFGRAPSDELV